MHIYDSFKEELLGKVNNVLSRYKLGVSRFAIVYDFESLDFSHIYLAVLTKGLEKDYRDRIVSDSDLELLWNPEDFSEFATADLTINLSAEAEGVLRNTLEEQDGYECLIRKAICSVCSLINDGLVGAFVYAVDPELSDLRVNLHSIGNIPPKEVAELPSWV